MAASHEPSSLREWSMFITASKFDKRGEQDYKEFREKRSKST